MPISIASIFHWLLTDTYLGEVVRLVTRSAVAGEAAFSVVTVAITTHAVHDLTLVHVHARVVL